MTACLKLFLLEISLRVRIDRVQYGLVELSISLFALLLISVAEPFGFALSCAASAGAVLAAAFAGVLGALFAFLHVVLSLDGFALLAGTAGLFVTLPVVMAASRRIEWAAPPSTVPPGVRPCSTASPSPALPPS